MSKKNIKTSYNRILEISDDAKQITMPDSRYYQRNGKYYPSITYVLSCYPKGKFFQDWLKKVGYSCDMVCEIDGELWIIDFKTSNHLQTTHELQTAIYGKCYEECFGKTADRYGILWLKSSKRGPKEGAIQGKGWELYESKRTQEENLDVFKTVKKLFDLENPRHSPIFTEFKTTAKRIL